MKPDHVQCGPYVNVSERKALERIRARLSEAPGSDKWLLLTNLAFSTTHRRQSEEIDIIAIGPPGAQVVEVKHWTTAWVKRNPDLVDQEAERLTVKAKKISGILREQVADLPVVDGVFLVTQASSKVAKITDCGPVRGIPFFTLKTCDDAIGLYATKVLSSEKVKLLGKALTPRIAVAVDGTLKRMGDYSGLVLLTPCEQRFHRVYNATHASRRERVKLHLYDLSASDDAKTLQRAEREWRSLNRLQRYEWVPRIVDSFQDAPGYAGEIKFFTMADPLAPSIEQRTADDSWDARARLNFARDSVRALRELHEARSDSEPPTVHRNLTPRTILVKHDNSPILTGFEQSRIPAETTVGDPPDEQERLSDVVAPEIRRLGIGAADRRSDVYSLCASLSVLFKDMPEEEGMIAQIAEILASGTEDEPQQRSSLSELDDRLSGAMGVPIPPPPPPPALYWTEDQVVPFGDSSYRIVSSLGSGGVGTAFKVVKLDHNTAEELGPYVAKAVRDKKTGSRVLRSYELAHAHLRHSALSTIFEVAPEWRDNTFVALMTWIDGEPLDEYTGLVSPLAEDLRQESGEALAIGWLRDACEGLNVLHSNDLIHGDVSPRNMIVSGTKLALTDYDCVTRIGTSAVSPGTVSYSPPSREKGPGAEPSDDLFALAASFFHVLFGKEPFDHEGGRNKERGLNWDGVNRYDYPRLSEFLDRATSPNPSKHFANVAAAISLLDAIEGSKGSADGGESSFWKAVYDVVKFPIILSIIPLESVIKSVRFGTKSSKK